MVITLDTHAYFWLTYFTVFSSITWLTKADSCCVCYLALPTILAFFGFTRRLFYYISATTTTKGKLNYDVAVFFSLTKPYKLQNLSASEYAHSPAIEISIVSCLIEDKQIVMKIIWKGNMESFMVAIPIYLIWGT